MSEPLGIHDMRALRALRDPIAHGIEILRVEGDLAGLPIATLRVDRVVRPHHATGLVDPECRRHVARDIELSHVQRLVDQAWMALVRGGDKRLGGLSPFGVARDRDDLEVLVFQLLPQLLPDRQVKPAASPCRPEKQEHLFAAQLGG